MEAARLKRAARFGIPVVVPSAVAENKAERTEGKGGGGKKDKKGKGGGGGLSEEDKARIAARADRFGTSTAPAGGEKKRPAVEVAPVDPEEEERRKKRAARFGLA